MRMMRVHAGDRGSLPMALLVITLGISMSAVLTPLVVRQIVSTRTVEGRNTALNAAQTGMDLMMARVRAAADDKLNGLLENLPPCTLGGDGAVSGTDETLPWTVTVAYKDQDGDPLACQSSTKGPSGVPSTAIVTSVGGGPGTVKRTLTATYVFTTSNTNIPGGQIKIDTSSLGDQCIDAGSAKSPAAGIKPTMKTCNGKSPQQFGYTSDLYLKLVYSETATAQYGMCLDAGSSHSSGNDVSFQPCPATRTSRFQWSLDGASMFRSTNPSSGAVESLCLSLVTPNGAGSLIELGSCSYTSNRTIWRSGTGVGAGMAGDSTAQLVNYEQFSRCLDVTNQDPDYSYMIAWFCKQAPNGNVDWNQQWVHPVPSPPAVYATGNIIVTRSGTAYCLRSPQSVASNAYTTVDPCTTANKPTAPFQWTVFHDTGDYNTSYRIQDASGYCLVPTDQDAVPKDAHSDGTSKVKVAVCDSSELQKWNAPPNINKPTPLTDLVEK